MDFPIENGGSFHIYVSLPEGMAPIMENEVFNHEMEVPWQPQLWPGSTDFVVLAIVFRAMGAEPHLDVSVHQIVELIR